jgi:hypothetical protein
MPCTPFFFSALPSRSMNSARANPFPARGVHGVSFYNDNLACRHRTYHGFDPESLANSVIVEGRAKSGKSAAENPSASYYPQALRWHLRMGPSSCAMHIRRFRRGGLRVDRDAPRHAHPVRCTVTRLYAVMCLLRRHSRIRDVAISFKWVFQFRTLFAQRSSPTSYCCSDATFSCTCVRVYPASSASSGKSQSVSGTLMLGTGSILAAFFLRRHEHDASVSLPVPTKVRGAPRISSVSMPHV